MNPADEAWVKELYQHNAPKIYKVVLRRLEDPEEAQNIIQETFLALLEKFDLVKHHPNPAGWLMKAAHFLILQAITGNENGSNTKRNWMMPSPGSVLLQPSCSPCEICFRRGLPSGNKICLSGFMKTA